MGVKRRDFMTMAAATAAGAGATAAGVSREASAQDGATQVGMHSEGTTYYFDPIGLHVEQGDTVEFAIESGAHSSTAYKKGNGGAQETRIPEGAKAWDSGTISGQGSTFKHTFKTPGTYDYFCIPHKSLGMVGRIVVGEPGGPAEGSMPPDGDVPESQTIVDQGSVSFSQFSGGGDGGGGGGGGSGSGGGGGGGEGGVALHELGVPYQAHFVGLGAIFAVLTSVVYSFFFLKYADSPEHTDQRDR
ncbi:MAG: plastocyanin/azurin family copper-binding protein [Halobacteria archaeon]|nr:plastocyanin/azurin family copper-binding protein [Halobacteria archaeon]